MDGWVRQAYVGLLCLCETMQCVMVPEPRPDYQPTASDGQAGWSRLSLRFLKAQKPHASRRYVGALPTDLYRTALCILPKLG